MAAQKKNKQAAKATVKSDPKFQIEQLRKNCVKLFGVTTSTFDGAMYGHAESELTIAEAKKIIDIFQNGGEN